MSSKRYLNLTRNIILLRKIMLPRIFNPIGKYPSKMQPKIRGYKLLVHAEIEAFLEDRAREVVDWAYVRYCSGKPSKKVIPSLLAFPRIKFELINNLYSKLVKNPSLKFVALESRIDEVFKQYKNSLVTNNGVKKDNIIKILIPIGIGIDQLDTAWMSTIDSFGSHRGHIAHTSGGSMTTLLDPKTEYDTVNIILKGLEQIDRLLSTLK